MNSLRSISILFFLFLVLLPESSQAMSRLPAIAQVSVGTSVNYVIEAGIVVLLMGVTLFVICKTSYRR